MNGLTDLDDLLEQARRCTSDAERWSVLAEAWRAYCDGGPFSWPFDSPALMQSLVPPLSD